jgi:hypothetical protein
MLLGVDMFGAYPAGAGNAISFYSHDSGRTGRI